MKLEFSDAEMSPLIQKIVAEVLRQHKAAEAKANGRLGYSESEAAALLSVPPHVLRDCRLRQEISARMVGKRYIYSRDELMIFLNETE